MRKMTRRGFMAGAAAGAAALTFPIRRVLGANEALNFGFIGVGDRGSYSAKWFSGLKDVRVAAVCDADSSHVAANKAKFPDAKAEMDLRKVLDNKDINAVVISTCNHWHALAAVWACQAGKDVYVEKPVSENIWEGRKIVEAARKYNRIVQGGTQQRSDPVQAQIRELIKSEKLGKMLWIRGNRFGTRAGIGKTAALLKPPTEVDYNMWLGPAQDLPMHREKFHYDWHWVWNTGAGEMGNWGVHVLDDIRNMLSDKCSLPNRVLAGGGRLAWNDAGETPNVHFVYFDTGVVPVIFSLSNLPRKPGSSGAPAYRSIQSGYVIQFENGYYAGGRGGGRSYDKDGKQLQSFKGDGGGEHAKNFVAAIKSRDRSIQNAEIEQTHYSSGWCHLANIAFRLGGAYDAQQALAAAPTFGPWKELLDGFSTHLEANKIDPKDPALRLSTMLEFDSAKETFTGPSATPEALALLRREYRKGFVMPEQV
jgi:predicted dehydrogenase